MRLQVQDIDSVMWAVVGYPRIFATLREVRYPGAFVLEFGAIRPACLSICARRATASAAG